MGTPLSLHLLFRTSRMTAPRRVRSAGVGSTDSTLPCLSSSQIKFQSSSCSVGGEYDANVASAGANRY